VNIPKTYSSKRLCKHLEKIGFTYVFLWRNKNRLYFGCRTSIPQEAKYVESWRNTASAWAGWSRFDIPVDRYGGVHSLLISTSSTLGSPTCHQSTQQDNAYRAKYQKADRASNLCTLWLLLGLYMNTVVCSRILRFYYLRTYTVYQRVSELSPSSFVRFFC
jgi:hypothetical protein